MPRVAVRVHLGAEPAHGILAMVGWSAAGHVAFVVAVIFAPHVLPSRPPPPLVLSGEIVSLPPPAAPAGASAAPAPARPAPIAAPPKEKAAPPKPPEPPKRRPEVIPPEPGKPKPPKPERETPPAPSRGTPSGSDAGAPAPPGQAAGPIAQGVGLGAGGTDPSGIPSISSGAFPYDYYRTTMVNLIRARWRRPVTPGLTQALRCAVAFTIARNGAVGEVALSAPSGFAPLDESAARAILDAGPLPPLPFQYSSESVRAELIFELTPD